MADFINGSGIGLHMPVKRIKPGTYVFGNNKKTTYVRELRNVLMVRVGGGWMKLGDWIIKYMPDLEKNVYTFREMEMKSRKLLLFTFVVILFWDSVETKRK